MILMEQNYEIYLKRSLQAVGESPLRSLTRLQQGQCARRYHHHYHHHHPRHHHPHLHHHLHCDQIKVNINIAVTITSVGLHTWQICPFRWAAALVQLQGVGLLLEFSSFLAFSSSSPCWFTGSNHDHHSSKSTPAWRYSPKPTYCTTVLHPSGRRRTPIVSIPLFGAAEKGGIAAIYCYPTLFSCTIEFPHSWPWWPTGSSSTRFHYNFKDVNPLYFISYAGSV